MARTLAWRIPLTEEPDRLWSMGLQAMTNTFMLGFICSNYLTTSSSKDSADEVLPTHLTMETTCSFIIVVFGRWGRGEDVGLFVFRKW